MPRRNGTSFRTRNIATATLPQTLHSHCQITLDQARNQGATAGALTEEGKPAFVRRFLLLKPSILVVDDAILQPAPG